MKTRRKLQYSLLGFALAITIAGLGSDLAEAQTAPRRTKGFQRSRHTSDETQVTADRRSLLLSTGEDRPVELNFEIADEVKQVVAANKEVVIPQVVRIGDKTQIVFKPLKPGTASVTVRDNEGNMRLIFTVRVTGNNLLRVAGEIRQILQDIEGLEIRVIGQKVIVEGDILTPDDFGMIQKVIHDKVYEDIVLDKTKLSAMALTVLARRIQDEVNVFAPNVRTRVVNGVIFLEGSVDALDTARRAETVATYYLPEVRPAGVLERADPAIQKIGRRQLIYNALIVNPPPPKKLAKLVRVRFDFVELGKSYSKLFGFKWAPGFSGTDAIQFGTTAAGNVGVDAGTFSGTVSQLFPKLNWLTQAGYARVLKTGNLIVRSGEPAVLKDNRQFSYPVTNAQNVPSLTSITVGTALAVTPLIVGNSEDIQLEVKFSQGAPVGAVRAGTPPEVANHEVETKVYIRSGESAAIGGVEGNLASTAFNPDSADTGQQPIVNLQHSKNYKKDRSQFIVFMTPQIVENASDGTEDLKKNFRIKVK